jgi:antitoxin MazE
MQEDSMNTVIRKWGNSPAIRIPMSLMSSAHFDLEQKVTITVEDGRIVIEPLKQVTYSLDALVAGITPKNSHKEVSFGAPVGKELL